MDNLKLLHDLFLQSKGVCIDTRKLNEGEIFCALKGPNFDGHDYAMKALDNGASHVVVSDSTKIEQTEQTIFVSDTLVALQQLARLHRDNLTAKIIALTGSNGKTTTKELCHLVLSNMYNVKATKGNLNNHIGVPLTLLSFDKDTEIGIVEMGANHQGEITLLSEIANPDYGLITNIGKAHLEGFGGLEGVRKAKTELYRYLKKHSGTIIYNQDDKVLTEEVGDYSQTHKYSSKVFTPMVTDHSMLLQIAYGGESRMKTNMVGAYNVLNVAVALGLASLFDVPQVEAISSIENYIPTNNRSEYKEVNNNQWVLDAYNANPTSMKHSIDNFLQLNSDKKCLILGDMLELGDYSLDEHQSLVDYIARNEWHMVLLIGAEFRKVDIPTGNYYAFETVDELLSQELFEFPGEGNTYLMKGSRGIALERLLTEHI